MTLFETRRLFWAGRATRAHKVKQNTRSTNCRLATGDLEHELLTIAATKEEEEAPLISAASAGTIPLLLGSK